MYDNGVCLIASAEGPPNELYQTGDGASMFERTVSRLVEMQSEDYLARRQVKPPQSPALSDLARANDAP
jgi:cell division protein ZapE